MAVLARLSGRFSIAFAKKLSNAVFRPDLVHVPNTRDENNEHCRAKVAVLDRIVNRSNSKKIQQKQKFYLPFGS